MGPQKDEGSVAIALSAAAPSFEAMSPLIYTISSEELNVTHVSQKCGMQFS